MEDEWEAAFELNGGANDSAADADSDGLSNLQEYTRKSHPKQADTDADGLNDGAEVNTHQTNPLRFDTDGDGLSDGQEIVTHHTNPSSKDTDNDGFTDGAELGDGADPLNPGNYPQNIAILGTGILGGKDEIDTGPGTEVLHANSGSPANVNDGNPGTRVDTYGRGFPG